MYWNGIANMHFDLWKIYQQFSNRMQAYIESAVDIIIKEQL